MNCNETQALAIDFQDNKLDSKLNNEVISHLHSCNTCKSYYDFADKALQQIDNDKVTANIPLFYEDIISKIDEDKKQHSISHYLKVSIAAASIFIAIFGGNYLGSYSVETLNAKVVEQSTDEILDVDLADNNFDLFNNF